MNLFWQVPLIVILIILTLGLISAALMFPGIGLLMLFLIVLCIAVVWALRDFDWSQIE